MPIHIVQECLYHRECRQGIEKVHDDAEIKLLKEIENLKKSREKLGKLEGVVC